VTGEELIMEARRRYMHDATHHAIVYTAVKSVLGNGGSAVERELTTQAASRALVLAEQPVPFVPSGAVASAPAERPWHRDK
jgi:hypothetical protein